MQNAKAKKLTLKEEIAKALDIKKSAKNQLFDKQIIEELHKYSSLFASIREAKKLAAEEAERAIKAISVSKIQKTALAKLPPKLLQVKENDKGKDVFLSRVSSVLSQNKPEQAKEFLGGVLSVFNNMQSGDRLLLKAVKGKDKVATQLFRNPFAFNVLNAIVDLLDRNISVFIYNNDASVSYIDYPALINLYAAGISTSVLERTVVYDSLFSEKYSRSHYNQFLQWTFGFARRNPSIEFSVLLNKYEKLEVDLTDIDIRAEEAIKQLRKKKELFGLSSVGLETAISKIREFNSLLHSFATQKKALKEQKEYKIKATVSDVAKIIKKLSPEQKKALIAELNNSL